MFGLCSELLEIVWICLLGFVRICWDLLRFVVICPEWLGFVGIRLELARICLHLFGIARFFPWICLLDVVVTCCDLLECVGMCLHLFKFVLDFWVCSEFVGIS